MMNPRSSYLAEHLHLSETFRFDTGLDADATETSQTGSVDARDYMQPTGILVVRTGSSDITHTLVLQHSDDNSSWTTISDDEYASGAAPAAISDQTGVTMATYVGLKRYVRAQLTSLNTSSAAATHAVALLCGGMKRITGL